MYTILKLRLSLRQLHDPGPCIPSIRILHVHVYPFLPVIISKSDMTIESTTIKIASLPSSACLCIWREDHILYYTGTQLSGICHLTTSLSKAIHLKHVQIVMISLFDWCFKLWIFHLHDKASIRIGENPK